jgi:hypothetical protein
VRSDTVLNTIRIDFACNDPDNGNFAGRVAQIHVGDALELVARNWNILSFNGCPRFRVDRRFIVLSGKRWPIVQSVDWYGNWCWNAYWFEPDVAADFLVWLRGRDLFQCEGGDVIACDSWERNEREMMRDILSVSA